MRKIVIIGSIIIIAIIIVVMQISNIQNQKQQAMAFNKQYEDYQNKDLYGIDIVTVINKATDNNEKYSISKDEKGIYIEDDKNSIKVELNLISKVNEATGEKTMITRPMERLQEVGLDGFITNFNLTTFQCKEIEYHKKTGRISKIVFEQVEQ